MDVLLFITVGLFLLVPYIRNTPLFLLLLASYFVRLILVFTQAYYRPLFFSSDQVRFMETAEHWSARGFYNALLYFDPTQSYVISWFAALVYSIFGVKHVLINIVMAWLGIISVIAAYKLSLLIQGSRRDALLIAFLFSLIPSLSIINAAYLRESFVITFFILSIYYAARWYRNLKARHALLSVLFLILTSIFHSAFYFLIPLYVGLFFLASMFAAQSKYKIYGLIFIASSAIFLPLAGTVISQSSKVIIAVNLFADDSPIFDENMSPNGLGLTQYYYPKLQTESVIKFLGSVFSRVHFFVLKPDFSMVDKITTLPRVFDTFLFSFILGGFLFLLLINFRWVQRYHGFVLFFVLPVLMLLTIGFSLGSAEVSTGQRHRLKFIGVTFVVLGSVLLCYYRERKRKRALRPGKLFPAQE